MTKVVLSKAIRNKARSLVRAAPGFDAWRESQGLPVGVDLLKAQILAGAAALGIMHEIEALAAHAALDSVAAELEDETEDETEARDMGEVPMGEPIWIAGPAGTGMGKAASDSDPVEVAIESVLETVRGVLGSKVLDTIADAVRPIAIAANKPVEVITVQAAPVAPPGALPFAKVASTSTLSSVFGVDKASPQASLPVKIWDAPDAPTPDPFYVVEPDRICETVPAFEHGDTVWLAGAAGTGKGTLFREYCARTKRPFVRIGFDRSTEVVDLRGQSEPVPGETHGARMVWADKVFTQAIRRPGCGILLDEPMLAPAGTIGIFQTILDDKRMTLPSGEVVPFAPGVVVGFADNSCGYGDETGVYAGVQAGNAALIDRCARMVLIDYLPIPLEALAIQRHTGAAHAACERLARFASVVRTAARLAGGEARPFSLRRLVAFMHAANRDRLPIERAWEITALSRLPDADKQVMRTAIGAHFDADTFARELSGKAGEPAAPAPAPLSQTSEQVNARRVFA